MELNNKTNSTTILNVYIKLRLNKMLLLNSILQETPETYV